MERAAQLPFDRNSFRSIYLWAEHFPDIIHLERYIPRFFRI